MQTISFPGRVERLKSAANWVTEAIPLKSISDITVRLFNLFVLMNSF